MARMTRLASIGRRWLALALAVALLLTASPPAAAIAPAGSITVNDTSEAVADDGKCTLKEAIIAANTNLASGAAPGECPAGSVSGVDTIVLQAGATYTFLTFTIGSIDDSALPEIVSAIAIQGNGAIIERDLTSPDLFSLFIVVTAGDLRLTNVTIRNGSNNQGGGVRVADTGQLTVTGSTFTNNAANPTGGAIDARGVGLTVTNSTFSNNSAIIGGAIYHDADISATVSSTSFTGNRAQMGGGIHHALGVLTVTEGSFSGNVSQGLGGGITNSGSLNLINTTLSDNGADVGGGLYNSSYHTDVVGARIREFGKVVVTGSTLSGNSAVIGGGATNDGRLTASNSTVSGNSANYGAGIYASNDTLTLTNVTIANNEALGQGGGVYAAGVGTLNASNTIIAGNRALNQGSIFFAAELGGIDTSDTFLAGNQADRSDDCVARSIRGVANLVGSGTGCAATGAGTRTVVPGRVFTSVLGPLAANGGATQTHALLAGSLALDAGDAGLCAAAPVNNLDQRGTTRPRDGDGNGSAICDIGAFEPATVPTAGALTWYFAEGYTGNGFDTYLTIQNPNPIASQVTITYYLSAAPPVAKNITVPATSRTTIAVHDSIAGVGRGQAVAAKVGSTNEVGIIVERPMYFTYGAGINGGHIVLGVTAPRSSWYFAEGYTGAGFDEYLTILNANDTAAPVTITYYLASGAPVTKTLSVPATSRYTVVVHGTTEGVGRNQAVSARVETNNAGGIVVERPMYFAYSGSVSVKEGHNVIGAGMPQTRWYFPDGSTATGTDTFLTILNPNDTPAPVTITYSLTNGTIRTRTLTVAATARATVAVHDASQVGRDQTMAIQVETSHAGGVVAERPTYSSTGATTVLGSSAARPIWFFAEGYTGTGFTEQVVIFNPSTTAANIIMTYYLGASDVTTVTLTAAAGARVVANVHDSLTGVGPGQTVAAKVETTNPDGVVAERVMRFLYNGAIPGAHAVVGYAP